MFMGCNKVEDKPSNKSEEKSLVPTVFFMDNGEGSSQNSVGNDQNSQTTTNLLPLDVNAHLNRLNSINNRSLIETALSAPEPSPYRTPENNNLFLTGLWTAHNNITEVLNNAFRDCNAALGHYKNPRTHAAIERSREVLESDVIYEVMEKNETIMKKIAAYHKTGVQVESSYVNGKYLRTYSMIKQNSGYFQMRRRWIGHSYGR
jgi:hypothetical protein